MALMECIIFASVSAVMLGTPNPPLENPTAYCSAWGSVSWTLCAVAIAAFLASIVTIIRLTKEKRKNSQNREGKESRRLKAEKRKNSQSREDKESRRLIAENSSSNCLACSDVCCGLLFAAILALVPFIVLFSSLFEENTPANCSTWKPYSWFFFAASIAAVFVFIVTLICLIKEIHNSSQDSWPAESKTELKAQNDELMAENETLKLENETLEIKNEILGAQSQKADVILDPRTAHPKLKVSEDGKNVWNTGNVSKVSDWEKRFDSRTFILGKSGFSEGKHYWEVEIGQNKTWDLGVASATIYRKGEITLSPENGYWVIGCDDGRDYWARTEQWTRLKVNGKLTRLGIFLDKSDGSLSFYDVCSQRKLHTYKTFSDEELYPFFYIGSVTEQPLKIV